jgi:O-acetyl-ADP-ribose deacetylase (regulator of RNase III)
MIYTKYGDVLNVDTGIIVHGCNCYGVMGSGIARSIKERFPTAYQVYREKFESSGLKLGEITYVEVSDRKWIVNANTQQGTGSGRQVSYDAIVSCFEKVFLLASLIKVDELTAPNIIFPKIGAGLGGGDWEIISTIIDVTIPDEFQKTLYLYE